MSKELIKKEKELKETLLQVAKLEEQIAQLRIQEEGAKPSTTLQERFPIDTEVKLTGRNEKLRLRRKKAVVVGHSTCFVKLEREGEQFRRAPESITRTNCDGFKEEKGGGPSDRP